MENILRSQGFKYESDLGTGGNGRVVRCFQLSTGCHVAVKLPAFGDVKQNAEFVREFEFLTTLKHDNIVQVYSFKTSPLMIVMEWMPSGSLRSLQDETQFRLHEEVIRKFMLDALRGLAYLHERNVLHRDVKPGNMLLKDGAVKLSDFGLSIDEVLVTRTSPNCGTIAYMGPETLGDGEKDPGRHSSQGLSDMWSWACSVVELGSANPLWAELGPNISRNPYALAIRIALHKVHPKIPNHFSTPLQQILERCFQREYKTRPTAAELLTDPYFTAPTLPPDAETFEAYKLALEAEETKQENSFAPSVAGCADVRDSCAVTQTASSASGPHPQQDVVPQQPQPLLQPSDDETEKHQPHPGPPTAVTRAWSAEGRVVLTGHADWVRSIAFSSSGAYLASGGDDAAVRLWAVSTGTLFKELLPRHDAAVCCVAYAPNDDTVLASGSDDGTVRLWDVPSGAVAMVLRGHTEGVKCIAFSPDGATLASGSNDETIRVYRVSSGQLLRSLEGHTWSVLSVAFSPDGVALASGSGAEDATVRLWDIANGSETKVLEGHTDSVNTVAFSPDGATLATGGNDETLRLWHVASGTLQREVGEVGTMLGIIRCVAFSPSGSTIATAGEDKSVRLIDVATGKELKSLLGHKSFVCAVCFSPDGSIVASGGADGTVHLWRWEP